MVLGAPPSGVLFRGEEAPQVWLPSCDLWSAMSRSPVFARRYTTLSLSGFLAPEKPDLVRTGWPTILTLEHGRGETLKKHLNNTSPPRTY